MELSGVATVTATAAAAVVAAESVGAAFWVSGVRPPSPRSLVRPRNPRSPSPLRPHEVRKVCSARGARMWNSRSAHSVTPAYRGLPLFGACTLMRYVRPTGRTPLFSRPSSPRPLHPCTQALSRHPTSSTLLLAFLPPSSLPPAMVPRRLIPRPIAFYHKVEFTRISSDDCLPTE